MIPPLTIEAANLGMADTLILLILALVVFGPRKLPMIGRQVGKLLYELRKASNDFRFQMEEEIRSSESEDKSRSEEEKRWRDETQQPKDLPSFEQMTADAIATGERSAAKYIAEHPEEFADSATAAAADAPTTAGADAASLAESAEPAPANESAPLVAEAVSEPAPAEALPTSTVEAETKHG